MSRPRKAARSDGVVGPRRRGTRKNWLAISLPDLTDELEQARRRSAAADEPVRAEGPTADAESPMIRTLRRLDSVIHDFIACLDQVHHHASVDLTGSGNVARFLSILESVPPAGGPLLGPPVLCGISPPIGLESVLSFLGSLHKTGILRVRSEGTTFMISVVRGDVVHAVSHPRPEAELLGSILVERSAIDRETLTRFLETHGASAGRLGEALNRQELLSTEELRAALEVQLQRLFDRLLAARTSEWCFHEGEATLSYIHLRVNATGVLLESARKRDEDGVDGSAGRAS